MNFSDLMYSAFLSEQERTKAERMTFEGNKVKVGASSVAGCARKTAYPILFGEKPPTLEEFFRMRKGNIAEGVIERNLDEMGIKYERQGEYRGTGIFDFFLVHPDILIDLSDPGDNLSEDAQKFIQRSIDKGCKFILIELKTTNSIPSEPHDYWVRQINVQAEYIAEAKGISPEQIDMYVYAMELNDGRHAEFNIPYQVEEVLIAQDDAISFVNVIEDYIVFANKEKDSMEFSINDVNRRVGSLCSVCKWAQDCLGSGKIVNLPDDIAREVKYVKEWSKQEKNIRAARDEIKKFLLSSGVKKGKAPGYAVTIKGGNKREVLDPKSYTPEEKLELAKRNADFVTVNVKELAKFRESKDEKDLWIVDKKHLVEKTSPVSIMITETKNKEK